MGFYAFRVWPSKNPADFHGRAPSWLARLPAPIAVIGVIAAVVWFGTFFVALTGGWYLECGTAESPQGGIDCFDALPGSAQTDSPLAGWFGLTALWWTLVGATVVFVICAVGAGRQDRKMGGDA